MTFSTYNMPTRKQFYNVLLVELSNSYDALSQFFISSGLSHFPRSETLNQVKETVCFHALNWENGTLKLLISWLLVISFSLNMKQLEIVIL